MQNVVVMMDHSVMSAKTDTMQVMAIVYYAHHLVQHVLVPAQVVFHV